MDIPTVTVTRQLPRRPALAARNGGHAQDRGLDRDGHGHRPHPLDHHGRQLARPRSSSSSIATRNRPWMMCATRSAASARRSRPRWKIRSSPGSRPRAARCSPTASLLDMSEEELSWFVDLTVSRELSSIEGMGAIKRVGGVDREIRVDLDPDALNALGTTAGDISRQLRRIAGRAARRRGARRQPGAERAHGRDVRVRSGSRRAADPAAGQPHRAPRCHRRRARSGRRAAQRWRCWTASRSSASSVTRAVARARSALPMRRSRPSRELAAKYPKIQFTAGQQHGQLRARVLQGLDADAARRRAARDHRRVAVPAGLARDSRFRHRAAAVGTADVLGAPLHCRLLAEHHDDAGAVAGRRHPGR